MIKVYLEKPPATTKRDSVVLSKIVVVPKERKPLDQLRYLSENFTGDELKLKINARSIMILFKETLPAIMDRVTQLLETEIYPLFTDHKLFRIFDSNSFEFNTSYDLESHLTKRGLIQNMGVTIRLEGFKKAGIKAFDITSDLWFNFNDYNYTVGSFRLEPWLTKLYDQLLSETELEQVTDNFANHIIGRINDMILRIR